MNFSCVVHFKGGGGKYALLFFHACLVNLIGGGKLFIELIMNKLFLPGVYTFVRNTQKIWYDDKE